MRFTGTAHNRLSYAGALLALLGVMGMLFLLVLTTLAGGDAPYGSLIIFLMLPAVIVVGLAGIPIGMLRERRHRARTGRPTIEAFPVLDLNDPRQRLRLVVGAVIGLALIFATNFASYQAYEHTESVAFCGQTCHVTMEPEAVAHQSSPHARTSCVACHIGPGGEAFIRAKLSGLRQVHAVLTNTVPTPIPVPIENLRPATETCQTCHWPEQYYVPQYRRFIHFLADDPNTRWEIHLRLMTGGGGPHVSGAGGIHAHHSGVNKTIEYVAGDRTRTDIPWVRVTDRTSGRITEYLTPAIAKEFPEGTTPGLGDTGSHLVRTMDCLDCHNRPAHRFKDPDLELNALLAAGKIDPTLPGVKKVGLELLKAEYDTTEVAVAAIASGLQGFYRAKHAGIATQRKDEITTAAAALQETYRHNFFPRMKVRWDTYPDHSGHLTSPGCFRCHDGNHKSRQGQVLASDCRTCHVILAQGGPDAMTHAMSLEGLEFNHPGDLGDTWKDMACPDCHGAAS